MSECIICQRPLNHPDSVRIGMGRECESKAAEVLRVIEQMTQAERDRGFAKREKR